MNPFKSRTSAVVAGAAVLALAGGGSVAIADQMIGSKDVRNGSLGMRDFNDFTTNKINKGGERGPRGAMGPAGPAGQDGADGADGKDGAQGPAGPQGQAGPPATVGLSHWSNAVEFAPGQNTTVQADCQKDGHLAIGGGFSNDKNSDKVQIIFSRNTAGAAGTDAYGAGWIVRAKNNDTVPVSVRAWVVCAEVVEDEPTS